MTKILLPQVDCLTAEEFLEALSPLETNFCNDDEGFWLFRGQWEDETWKLIPSLYRESTKEKIIQLTTGNVENEFDLIERDFLVQFFEIADKRGLMLPDDSQELRRELRKIKKNNYRVGEYFRLLQTTSNLFSLLALAQHYGIPTRLLDWTRNSWIAAFFAGEFAFEKQLHPEKKLVVWAFYVPEFSNTDDFFDIDIPVQIVTAPSATNSNLKAQQGVFTWLNPNYAKGTKDSCPALNELISSLAKGDYRGNPRAHDFAKKCKFRKVTVPQIEAMNLLALLAKLDITPSAIYPGYHSIVSDIKNKNMWEKR